MDKREFRRALVKAKRVLIYGHESQEQYFTSLEALAAKLFLRMSQMYDPLGARLGGFTPDARTRITLYPFRRKVSPQ
jgi:hypothetical protein